LGHGVTLDLAKDQVVLTLTGPKVRGRQVKLRPASETEVPEPETPPAPPVEIDWVLR
jgi:hypothetical protein